MQQREGAVCSTKGLSFFSFTVQNMSPVKRCMYGTLTKEHGLTEPAMVLHHMSLYTVMACVKTGLVCLCVCMHVCLCYKGT